MMDWHPGKCYQSIKLVLLFYCFCSDHMPQAIMDTILPGLLRYRECDIETIDGDIIQVNVTDDTDTTAPTANFTFNNISTEDVCKSQRKRDDSIQIAVIGALFHVPMLLLGIPAGRLVSKINANWVYAGARLVTGLSSLSFGYFTHSMVLLYLYPVCYGTGWLLSEVSLYHILATTFPKDSIRSRAISFGYTITTVGFVLGYIAGTHFFAAHGVQTYLVLGAIDLNVGAIYAHVSLQNRQMEENHRLIDKETQVTKSITSSGLATLCYVQNFVVYFTFRVVAVIAPLWLQTELKLTLTENGLTFGIPAVIHVALLILVVIFVASNTARWVTLLVFILAEAGGFMGYPFVTDMWEAMGTESLARACKMVMMALGPSLLFHIVDQQQLGSYAKISGSFATVRHLGSVCGSLCAGLLVTWFGFKFVCIATGTFLIPIGLLSITYHKLP